VQEDDDRGPRWAGLAIENVDAVDPDGAVVGLRRLGGRRRSGDGPVRGCARGQRGGDDARDDGTTVRGGAAEVMERWSVTCNF
jgi:hypothetical protein